MNLPAGPQRSALDPDGEALREQARQLMEISLDLIATSTRLVGQRDELARGARRALLTYRQAADALGISDDLLRTAFIATGELPIVQLGEASPRIDPADLDALIAQRKLVRGSTRVRHLAAVGGRR